MYVVKVDYDVRYIATVVHVYCKCMFLMFYLFFQMYVASVFIWMLHMFYNMLQAFYLDVAYVLQLFSSVFLKCFVRTF
jgi:hypothetical protein